MPDALVSVIIPVYNGERYLAEALQSVLVQTYQPVEVIMIDDGSVDESAAMARSFPMVQLYSQPNQGVAAARNRGLKLARGEWLAFLDQDDLWLPDKLSRQMARLQHQPKAECVLTQQLIFLEAGFERPAWLRPELLDQAQPGLTPSTLLAHRSVFAKVGEFDLGHSTASDVDWFFRARDAGIALETVPRPLVRKRVHSGNQSRLVKALHAEYLQIARKSIRRKK